MRKSKKSASAPARKSSVSSELRRRVTIHSLILIIFASGVVALFRISQLYVDRRLAYPTRPPTVELANRPVWMSDFLAEQIIKSAEPVGLHSAFDQQLLISTANALRRNPWVRQVNQVRRGYGREPGDTLDIDCDYRAPAALVRWGDNYRLIDTQGIELPEQYTSDQVPKIMAGADGRINVRIIEGVSRSPQGSGRLWPGDDLAAGLEMARILGPTDWAQQVRDIDVSNFEGRRDSKQAQIVLVTTFGTQIRWGRAPGAKDAFVEVTATQKLANLQNIYQKTGRVDANEPWIDVRFDRVTGPAPQNNASAQAAAGQ